MNLGTAEASPGITSSQATSLAKMLQAEFTKFSSDSSHSFADDTNTTGRKTLPAQGPTQCLSCDKMLQMEIERMAVSKKEATATTTHQDDDDPTVLDREQLVEKLLGKLSNTIYLYPTRTHHRRISEGVGDATCKAKG